jgi:hypothetical protein
MKPATSLLILFYDLPIVGFPPSFDMNLFRCFAFEEIITILISVLMSHALTCVITCSAHNPM